MFKKNYTDFYSLIFDQFFSGSPRAYPNISFSRLEKYFIFGLAFFISFLTFIAFLTNSLVYHFPGNNYFPPNILIIGSIITLIVFGFYLLFGKNNYYYLSFEFFYFFFVILLLAGLTNVAQFSPFPPIDSHLVALDTMLGVDLVSIIAWTNHFPWLTKILNASYNTLPYQMCYLPILIIVTRRFDYLREYYALILLAGLFGFTFYYFFPTTGPASVLKSSYFFSEQYDTGIKFSEIHHYISPSTQSGGLVAMPSFHIIWAWLCTYLIRGFRLLLFIIAPINILLACSCVLLGWHYFTDIIGSFIVLFLSHRIYAYAVKKLT